MRFLADESCDYAVVTALRAANHDVVAVSETNAGAQDALVFAMARDEARVLLTEDKDFGLLAYAVVRDTAGSSSFATRAARAAPSPPTSSISSPRWVDGSPAPSPCWSRAVLGCRDRARRDSDLPPPADNSDTPVQSRSGYPACRVDVRR